MNRIQTKIQQSQTWIIKLIMLSRQQQQVWKSIKRLFKKQGRISFELKEVTELLRIHPCSTLTKRFLDHPYTLSSAFKFYLLIHRLIIQQHPDCSILINLLPSIKYTIKGSIEKVLQQKMMQPYRLYLQKRIATLKDEREKKQLRVYQLLNLINLATSFSDLIYTLGRYYIDRYGWAVDFNILMGADLQRIYKQMVDCVSRPASKAILQQIEAVHEKMYVIFYNCYFHKYLKLYVPKWVITDIHIKQVRGRSYTPQKYSAQSTISQSGTAKNRSYSTLKTKTLITTKSKQIQQTLGDSCLFLNELRPQQIQQDPQIQQYPSINQPSKQPQHAKSNLKLEINQMEGQNGQRLKLLLSMQRVIKNCEY